MYKVRYNYPNVSQVAYRIFKSHEEALLFSKTVDLIEIVKVDHE